MLKNDGVYKKTEKSRTGDRLAALPAQGRPKD
jgi:hypothetical protein